MDVILPDIKRLASSGGVINRNDEDRISKLSDDVLCQVLSFLATKEAVATGILSKRWKYVWTSIPDIEIIDEALSDYESESDCSNKLKLFKDYVDHVLFHHGQTDIHKFDITCFTSYTSPYIYEWVCAVIACNVEELIIESGCMSAYDLPWRLFTCTTLVNLEIKGRFVLDLPTHIFFPCLKFLYLDDVVFGDDASARRLFSSCHVLETLTICRQEWDGLQVMIISVPSLKNLDITSNVRGSNKLRAEIDCPGLQYFGLHGKSEIEFIANFPSLVEARICGTCGIDLLEAISQVQVLNLYSDVLSSLHITNLENPLPAFHKLLQLELHLRESTGWDFLPRLLESSPNLEVLIFSEGLVVPEETTSGFGDFYWHNPEFVPQCLISHLKDIEINNFVGMLGEVYLVKYMLEFGLVLENVEIQCRDLGRRWGMKKKLGERIHYLSSCSRASKTCELDFFD